jgi:hypothetical protein
MAFDGSRMLGRAVAAGLAAVALAALAGSGGVVGCSSNKGSSEQPDAQTVCPVTADDAIGKSCGTEGLSCYPQYACGITQAILTCTCTGGHFQCTDVTGAQLADGGTPACPAVGDGGGPCPASESVANLSPCGQQQEGQQCAYPAECDGGVPSYDTCYCFTGQTKSGTVGLRWECSNTCGAAGGPLPDGGGHDAAMPPADAGSDAPETRDAAAD